VKLGTENRTQLIVAAVLGVVLLATLVYQFTPSSSTIASTAPATTSTDALVLPPNAARPPARHGSGTTGKKSAPQSLDPTLQLQLLAATQAIKYEGSGRNIFIAHAEDVKIPAPQGTGATDKDKQDKKDDVYHPPAVAAAPPIPLKFFGFANRPGEPKKVFLIKGDDTFIAGEGEIVDRRYKVVKISPTFVDIQDVVVSGPPQSIPLTLGNPS
jgi:hypothetical protein